MTPGPERGNNRYYGDGYDSGNRFGDTPDRPVAFEKPLSDLAGKPVRLEFDLKDAELYSFQFA